MTGVLGRMWEEIIARPDGPLALRFYLQPLMAGLFAFRDGRKDADTGQPPYFWSLLASTFGAPERCPPVVIGFPAEAVDVVAIDALGDRFQRLKGRAVVISNRERADRSWHHAISPDP